MNYLIRRDATYYAQVRLTYSARFVLKTDVYRQSLRTKDFEKAKIRLRYVLSWIADLEMKNTSEMDDYKLYRHNWTGNARTIADYLKDEWPVDEERLWQCSPSTPNGLIGLVAVDFQHILTHFFI